MHALVSRASPHCRPLCAGHAGRPCLRSARLQRPPFRPHWPKRTRVAVTVDDQSTSGVPEASQPASSSNPQEAAEIEELELQELDRAQEQLLAWMLYKNDKAKEEDLDEMVDYDEMGDEEYEELYDAVDQMIEESALTLSLGDKVLGTVYEVDNEAAYVDIGQKGSGVVPLGLCSTAKLKTPLEVLRPGMQREFTVLDTAGESGEVILALSVEEDEVFWARTRQLHENNVTIYVTVESANSGGLVVRYGDQHGFLPASHFGPTIVGAVEDLVGQQIPVRVLQLDEATDHIVFSNKGFTSVVFEPGQLVTGVIVAVKDFGLFVDVGSGLRALLHISQITGGRTLFNIESLFKVGDVIKAVVLSYDATSGRMVLSTSKLEPTPGDMLRDPKMVYANGEQSAKVFQDRLKKAIAGAAANEGYYPPPTADQLPPYPTN